MHSRHLTPRLLAALSDTPVVLLHGARQTGKFRTASDSEVDFVLEDRSGRCVGIEVKAGASLGEKDFSGLRGLRDALGERFRGGVVLYAGAEAVPFGKKLFAAPIVSLWSARQSETGSGHP